MNPKAKCRAAAAPSGVEVQTRRENSARRRYERAPHGLAARLERERRVRDLRQGRRRRLSRLDNLIAVVLLVAVLSACASGGWLGMHYHHHADSMTDDQ